MALANVAPGPIYSIVATDDGFVAAGKFGRIIVLNADLEIVQEYSLGDFEEDLGSSYIRSVAQSHGSTNLQKSLKGLRITCIYTCITIKFDLSRK